MRARARPQRGFTMLEMLVAGVVGAIVTTMALHVVASSNELSESGRVRLRASALHRKSHE
ncbi:MAG: PulJ/GspJ family protein, partial [Planctomycetota bacterium]